MNYLDALDLRFPGAKVITHVIPGFPYAQRDCPFCERELGVVNAIHLQGDEEIYKAIMRCFNSQCGAFDEDAKKSYIKVYYSGEIALNMFELVLLRYAFEEKA